MAKEKKNTEIIEEDLSVKERLFAFEYLIDFETERAALKAGYSANIARTKAFQWLAKDSINYKPKLNAFIQKQIEAREKKLQRSGEEVIKRLWEVNDRCIQKVAPLLDRKGEQVFTEDEAGEMKAAYIFDSKGAIASAGLLGKHYKVITDKTEVEHTGKINIEINYAPKQ